MKYRVYRKISFILSIFIFVSSLFSFYSISYAISPDDYMEGAHSWSESTTSQKWTQIFLYTVSQIKALVGGDFSSFLENDEAFTEYRNSHNIDEFVSDDGTEITIPQDFSELIKQALDDYAAENQPFTIERTYKPTDFLASDFMCKAGYEYFKSYFSSGSYSYVVSSANTNSKKIYVCDVSSLIKEGGAFVNKNVGINGSKRIIFINSDWIDSSFPVNVCNVISPESNIVTIEENYSIFDYCEHFNYGKVDTNRLNLITPDGGNIRVFKSRSDFINYSAGQRKIYYATDYYNYVPEDLTVSIDDLQKSVDGLSDAVEKLQQQVTDDMSESEIEDLLQQILDELKNNQGGNTGGDNTGGGNTGGGDTGGGSTGGGDVNIDIDLSDTNTWLSKIHTKLTDMFEQVKRLADNFESFFIFENTGINARYLASLQERILARLRALSPGSVAGDETGGDTGDGTEVQTSWLQEVLEDIRDTLKSIRRWSIADTVLDGVDAVADLVSLVKDFLSDAGAVVGTAASSLGDTAQMLTDKFPFSIPWDMALLVGLLQAEPQAPVFRLPIVIGSAGIEEYIEIDMSQFEVLSTILRSMLTLLYAYGILNMTTKVLNIGGGKP